MGIDFFFWRWDLFFARKRELGGGRVLGGGWCVFALLGGDFAFFFEGDFAFFLVFSRYAATISRAARTSLLALFFPSAGP